MLLRLLFNYKTFNSTLRVHYLIDIILFYFNSKCIQLQKYIHIKNDDSLRLMDIHITALCFPPQITTYNIYKSQMIAILNHVNHINHSTYCAPEIKSLSNSIYICIYIYAHAHYPFSHKTGCRNLEHQPRHSRVRDPPLKGHTGAAIKPEFIASTARADHILEIYGNHIGH